MNDNDKTKEELIAELQQLRREHKQYKATHPVANLWRKVIEHSPVSVQVVDKDGFSISVNQAHTDFFKSKPPKSYNVFTDKVLLDQGLSGFFDKLRNGEVVIFPDTKYNPRDYDPRLADNKVWLKTTGLPMVDAERKPVRFVVIHENISERIKLEETLSEKEKYIENLCRLERESIHREIHDELAVTLSTIKTYIGTVGNLVEEPKLKDKLKEAYEMSVTTTNKVSDILSGLLIDTIGDDNIIPAIEKLCKENSFMGNFSIIKNLPETLRLPKGYNYMFFHIVQEALLNVVRHARAQQVELSISVADDELNLLLSDDGIGIQAREIKAKSSAGIQSMNDRTAIMKGKFDISGKAGKGTEIRISIPLKP